ncbi:MAG: nitrate reductase molybdenum cofactor assembly chaperone [Pseudonocardia sp.]|nr:nitrate reductase molybdenum cofactor assembly chaperone [Pseudonocardia sp.]
MRAAAVLNERQRRMVWRVAALLLDYPGYPGERLLGLLDRIRAELATLPAPVHSTLRAFVDHAARTDPTALAADYVQTFDLRRRNCLHLSYYAFGDTRKRGMALLRFKHAYRAVGVELGDHELPDYLPVVLEFAATVDPVAGFRLLVEYRAVIELLRRSLVESGSPYASVLDAVSTTLPELTIPDRRRLAELAAQGPPVEEVGIEPFALDPALAPRTGARR